MLRWQEEVLASCAANATGSWVLTACSSLHVCVPVHGVDALPLQEGPGIMCGSVAAASNPRQQADGVLGPHIRAEGQLQGLLPQGGAWGIGQGCQAPFLL